MLDQDLFNAFATPAFMLEIADDGRVVYSGFNKAACQTAGLSASDVIGKTAREVYPERLGHVAYEHHCQVAAEGKPSTYDLTLPLRGAHRLVQTTLTPILDQDGKVLCLIGTSVDRSTEQVMIEQAAHMRAKSHEVEQFISLAAHDLRAPMRQVKMISSLLLEDFVDHGDGKLDLINMLSGISETATAMLNDIMTHVHATSLEPATDTFDLGSLCGDLFIMLDPIAQHSWSSDVARVETDRTAVHIVLRNLIDNALKHAGRAKVAMTISVAEAEPDMLCFSVRDNGVGLGEQTLTQIRTGDLKTGDSYGLHGLRRLITSRGGTLDAENADDGRGAMISFTIPGKIV